MSSIIRLLTIGQAMKGVHWSIFKIGENKNCSANLFSIISTKMAQILVEEDWGEEADRNPFPSGGMINKPSKRVKEVILKIPTSLWQLDSTFQNSQMPNHL